MEKQSIEFAIRVIGSSEKPDYDKVAQATIVYCKKNGLDPEVSPNEIREIHEIVELFDDHDVALIYLSTLSDDVTDVSIPIRNLKQKGIQKVESRLQELELINAIYDAANPINRITNYSLVKGRNRATIEIEITKKLASGWKPYGGIAITASNRPSTGGTKYVQAMVKFNPHPG